jgi:hypothetical protein
VIRPRHRLAGRWPARDSPVSPSRWCSRRLSSSSRRLRLQVCASCPALGTPRRAGPILSLPRVASTPTTRGSARSWASIIRVSQRSRSGSPSRLSYGVRRALGTETAPDVSAGARSVRWWMWRETDDETPAPGDSAVLEPHGQHQPQPIGGETGPAATRRCLRAPLPPHLLRRPASADVAHGPRVHRCPRRHHAARADALA